jgi:hypothetical protein
MHNLLLQIKGNKSLIVRPAVAEDVAHGFDVTGIDGRVVIENTGYAAHCVKMPAGEKSGKRNLFLWLD